MQNVYVAGHPGKKFSVFNELLQVNNRYAFAAVQESE